jgi:hypothetical protein
MLVDREQMGSAPLMLGQLSEEPQIVEEMMWLEEGATELSPGFERFHNRERKSRLHQEVDVPL